jgi:dTDP-4-amino-4,6-dideoxygalactose transaminase
MSFVIPRQKIYDLNFFSLKLKNLDCINYLENKLRNYFDTILLKPIFNARVGIYYAVKKSISVEKKKVLICPFTIFDVINMIILAGGEPIFIDSNKNSPHISLKEVKKNFNKNVACCIVTHYHNNCPDIDKIAKFCSQKKIKLIEDCALVIGATKKKKQVGYHGDYAVYSFGLLKTVSTYSMGLLRFKYKKDFDEFKYLNVQSKNRYLSLILKALKFKFLMSPLLFNLFVFRLIKFGELFDIKFLKNLTKNDPNPILRKYLPKIFLTRPNYGLQKDVYRQFKLLPERLKQRRNNYKKYYSLIKNFKNIHSFKVNLKEDSCINFSILVRNKSEFIKKLIKNNIDLSPYYYRNCANLKIFKKFKLKELKNLNDYVSKVVFFPTYGEIRTVYIHKIVNVIKNKL